jgi:hypothetical protein
MHDRTPWLRIVNPLCRRQKVELSRKLQLYSIAINLLTNCNTRAQTALSTGVAAPVPPGQTLAFNEIGEAKLSLETAVAQAPPRENL